MVVQEKIPWLPSCNMATIKKIAAVVGSSGIGKSKLAVELCKALTGQVINADALQVKSISNLKIEAKLTSSNLGL